MTVSIYDLKILNDKIKLFGVTLSEEEEFAILDIWDDLNKVFPADSNVAINFYQKGKTFRAEALVGVNHQCFISRKESNCLIDLSLKLKNEILFKLGRNNRNNGFGSIPQAIAF